VDLKQERDGAARCDRGGDTVGDPFKDTSSVALNPVIKFTTLFGLLAVELALSCRGTIRTASMAYPGLSLAFFLVAAVFVWRSFYSMRIGAVCGGRRRDPGQFAGKYTATK